MQQKQKFLMKTVVCEMCCLAAENSRLTGFPVFFGKTASREVKLGGEKRIEEDGSSVSSSFFFDGTGA
jgi:hypothetical protein